MSTRSTLLSVLLVLLAAGGAFFLSSSKREVRSLEPGSGQGFAPSRDREPAEKAALEPGQRLDVDSRQTDSQQSDRGLLDLLERPSELVTRFFSGYNPGAYTEAELELIRDRVARSIFDDGARSTAAAVMDRFSDLGAEPRLQRLLDDGVPGAEVERIRRIAEGLAAELSAEVNALAPLFDEWYQLGIRNGALKSSPSSVPMDTQASTPVEASGGSGMLQSIAIGPKHYVLQMDAAMHPEYDTQHQRTKRLYREAQRLLEREYAAARGGNRHQRSDPPPLPPR